MSMPGFTAETSLYQTSGNYRTGLAFDRVRGGVQLAQDNCFSNCMDDCIGGPLTAAQCSASCHRRCSPAPPPPPSGPSGPFCHGFQCPDASYVCTTTGCCPIQWAYDPPNPPGTPLPFPLPPDGRFLRCVQPNKECPSKNPLRCGDTLGGCCPERWDCTSFLGRGTCTDPDSNVPSIFR